MTEELAVYEHQNSLVNIEDFAMSAGALVKQVNLIQDVMSKVMKDGEHYGTIPGTNKPTLLKPGAEKLTLLFRFNPDYQIMMQDRDEFFISYTIKCTLTHIPTGQIIASGVGSCNSRETKYRYRYIEESTGKPIPKEYWKAKSDGNSKEMKRLIGGEGFRAAKIDGSWVIATSQRIENDNPYDLDNTLMKMACKRALVAATLNATAASDIFTQDVEDMDPEIIGKGKPGPTGKTPPPQPQRKSQTGQKPASGGTTGGIQTVQKRALEGMLKTLGIETPEQQVETIGPIINRKFKSLDELTKDEAQAAITGLGKMNSEDPKECTQDPNTCPLSGWAEDKAFCGEEGDPCKYQGE